MVRAGKGQGKGQDERRACRREILLPRARMLRGWARRPVGTGLVALASWWWKVLGMPHEHPEYWLPTCLTYRSQPDMSLPGARRFHCAAPPPKSSLRPMFPAVFGFNGEIFLVRESANPRCAYQGKVDGRSLPRFDVELSRPSPPRGSPWVEFAKDQCQVVFASP